MFGDVHEGPNESGWPKFSLKAWRYAEPDNYYRSCFSATSIVSSLGQRNQSDGFPFIMDTVKSTMQASLQEQRKAYLGLITINQMAMAAVASAMGTLEGLNGKVKVWVVVLGV